MQGRSLFEGVKQADARVLRQINGNAVPHFDEVYLPVLFLDEQVRGFRTDGPAADDGDAPPDRALPSRTSSTSTAPPPGQPLNGRDKGDGTRGEDDRVGFPAVQFHFGDGGVQMDVHAQFADFALQIVAGFAVTRLVRRHGGQTQPPPSRGLSSHSSTRCPRSAATRAASMPLGPPPITMIRRASRAGRMAKASSVSRPVRTFRRT